MPITTATYADTTIASTTTEDPTPPFTTTIPEKLKPLSTTTIKPSNIRFSTIENPHEPQNFLAFLAQLQKATSTPSKMGPLSTSVETPTKENNQATNTLSTVTIVASTSTATTETTTTTQRTSKPLSMLTTTPMSTTQSVTPPTTHKTRTIPPSKLPQKTQQSANSTEKNSHWHDWSLYWVTSTEPQPKISITDRRKLPRIDDEDGKIMFKIKKLAIILCRHL